MFPPQLIGMVVKKSWQSYRQPKEVTSFGALLKSPSPEHILYLTIFTTLYKSSYSRVLLLLDLTHYQLCFLFGFLQLPSNYKCNHFNYINMLDIIESNLRPSGSVIQTLTELKFPSRKEESSRGWYSIRNAPTMQGSMGHFHSMKATFF